MGKARDFYPEDNPYDVSPSPSVGEPAPPFALPEAYGGSIALHDLLRDRIVVLAFYPSPFGMMCGVELKHLKDMYDEFRSAGAEVVGLATNSVPVMSAWRERLDLPFPQLSDLDGAVSSAYGLLLGKEGYLGGRCNRAVVIVDRDGIIRYRWIASDVIQAEEPDYDEVLEACRNISAALTSSPSPADSTR